MKLLNMPAYDAFNICERMSSQTQKLIQLIIALGNNNYGVNETIDDIIYVSRKFDDYYQYLRDNQYEDVSVVMYARLVNFAYTNRIFRICDIGCGYNPLQSLLFTTLDIRFEYTGIQQKHRNKKYFDVSLLDVNNEFNDDQVKYIDGQLPDKICDIWKPDRGRHKTLGCFLFADSFDHLVMPIPDDITSEQIMYNTRDTEKLERLFNYVVFTVPRNYTNEMFMESALNGIYDVVDITEPFSDSSRMNRLVILESKNKDNKMKEYDSYGGENVRF